jgi:hypothetical protein
MLGPIAAAVPQFAGPGAVAVFEVQAAAGVPDVVATVFDEDAIESRAGTGFVTDPAGLATLLALSDALGRWSALDARQARPPPLRYTRASRCRSSRSCLATPTSG